MAESQPDIYFCIKKNTIAQIHKLTQSKRYPENRYFNMAKKTQKKNQKFDQRFPSSQWVQAHRSRKMTSSHVLNVFFLIFV